MGGEFVGFDTSIFLKARSAELQMHFSETLYDVIRRTDSLLHAAISISSFEMRFQKLMSVESHHVNSVC